MGGLAELLVSKHATLAKIVLPLSESQLSSHRPATQSCSKYVLDPADQQGGALQMKAQEKLVKSDSFMGQIQLLEGQYLRHTTSANSL